MYPYLQIKLQCCGQCDDIPTAQRDRLLRASLTITAKGLLSTVHRNKEALSLFSLLCACIPLSLSQVQRVGPCRWRPAGCELHTLCWRCQWWGPKQCWFLVQTLLLSLHKLPQNYSHCSYHWNTKWKLWKDLSLCKLAGKQCRNGKEAFASCNGLNLATMPLFRLAG